MKTPKEFYTKRKAKGKAKADDTATKPDPAEQRIVATPPGDPSFCDRIADGVNAYQHDKCAEKANVMSPAGEAGECPCAGDSAGGTASGGVDLVVLIDSSGSMSQAATLISDIAPRAFEAAKERCDANANVTYLFVDRSDGGSTATGTTFGSLFTKSHERHLIDVASATPPFAADGDGKLDAEQGGKAIADISNNNNWTPNHCRAVLYISDEKVDSISGTIPDSQAAAAIAIAAANANNVAIFTHFVANVGGNSVPPGHPDRPTIAAHYQDMSDQTGGTAKIDTAATVFNDELYIDLISLAICEGCGNSGGCHTAEIPELEPCVSITWGDSECDCMEGDDHEEICISICNCYDNVTFKNVKIGGIVITDENGRRPPRLPDGSPSSELYSVGPYCFGDIGPCRDGEKSCVTRNAMIINRGLPPGTWKVRVVGLCFDVCHHYDEDILDFEFTVCKN